MAAGAAAGAAARLDAAAAVAPATPGTLWIARSARTGPSPRFVITVELKAHAQGVHMKRCAAFRIMIATRQPPYRTNCRAVPAGDSRRQRCIGRRVRTAVGGRLQGHLRPTGSRQCGGGGCSHCYSHRDGGCKRRYVCYCQILLLLLPPLKPLLLQLPHVTMYRMLQPSTSASLLLPRAAFPPQALLLPLPAPVPLLLQPTATSC